MAHRNRGCLQIGMARDVRLACYLTYIFFVCSSMITSTEMEGTATAVEY